MCNQDLQTCQQEYNVPYGRGVRSYSTEPDAAGTCAPVSSRWRYGSGMCRVVTVCVVGDDNAHALSQCFALRALGGARGAALPEHGGPGAPSRGQRAHTPRGETGSASWGGRLTGKGQKKSRDAVDVKKIERRAVSGSGRERTGARREFGKSWRVVPKKEGRANKGKYAFLLLTHALSLAFFLLRNLTLGNLKYCTNPGTALWVIPFDGVPFHLNGHH
jgi:hypothetical protein